MLFPQNFLGINPHTQIQPVRSGNRCASGDIIYASLGDLSNGRQGNISRCLDLDAGVGFPSERRSPKRRELTFALV